MESAVFRGPGRIGIERVAVPVPGPGQVCVRLEGCGVCASNLPVWEGRPWFQYPFAPGAPGHEGWGRIAAVGPQVQDLREGERVALLSCNAYAQYDLASQEAVVRLPAGLDGLAFPGEPLGCAMNAFRRSDIHAGQTVAVVGVGFMGALLILLARQAGALVIALSRRPYALAVARHCGAAEIIGTADRWAAVEQVKALTGGDGCDRVIEAAGEQATLDLATELTCEGGRLIIAGYHQDGPRQVNMQLWNWRGLDVINAHERDPAVAARGLREAVAAVAGGRLDPFPLLTHSYRLDELPTAFAALRQRPDGFLKAVVAL
ncbi:MAG: zinc-binding dehydrogenase [Pseudomonadota bacterium]|nr:zinc-binding dehydrogenase [Pseudomonadota bacterium]